MATTEDFLYTSNNDQDQWLESIWHSKEQQSSPFSNDSGFGEAEGSSPLSHQTQSGPYHETEHPFAQRGIAAFPALPENFSEMQFGFQAPEPTNFFPPQDNMPFLQMQDNSQDQNQPHAAFGVPQQIQYSHQHTHEQNHHGQQYQQPQVKQEVNIHEQQERQNFIQEQFSSSTLTSSDWQDSSEEEAPAPVPVTRGRKKKATGAAPENKKNLNIVQKHLTKTKKVRKTDKSTFELCLDSKNFRELTAKELIHLNSDQIERYSELLRERRKPTEQEEKDLKEVRKSIKNREYAQNSRQKEKEHKQQLQDQIQQLLQENGALQQRNSQLDTENKKLRSQMGEIHTAVQRDPTILQSLQAALSSPLSWLSRPQPTEQPFAATSFAASSLEGQGGRVNAKFAKRGTAAVASLLVVLLSFGFVFNLNSGGSDLALFGSASKQSPFEATPEPGPNWSAARRLNSIDQLDESWLDWSVRQISTPFTYFSSYDVHNSVSAAFGSPEPCFNDSNSTEELPFAEN